MTFLDSLIERTAGPSIPKDAFTVQMYVAKARAKGKRMSEDVARRILKDEFASGRLNSVEAVGPNKGRADWYWPAK